jgi:hypothetical protein
MIGCKSCANDPDPVNGVTYLVCTKGDRCRERLAITLLDRIGEHAADALIAGMACVVPVEPTWEMNEAWLDPQPGNWPAMIAAGRLKAMEEGR